MVKAFVYRVRLGRSLQYKKTLIAQILRTLFATGAGVVAGLFSHQALAAESAVSVRSYQIPPGPLGASLTQFAELAGVTLKFDAAMLGNRRTAGLHGS
jgi:hemoglobin/transferrin/lactoferrin receptor protein